MVRIYKNLHDRNGRQAGVRLFARSISIRNRMIFYGNFATMRCSMQIGTFNSNLLEHVAKLWLLFCRIKRGKTSSVSNKMKIEFVNLLEQIRNESCNLLRANCQ